MLIFAAVCGAVLLVAVLWDTFETIVLPRSFGPGIRITRLYYRTSWLLWSRAACVLKQGSRLREILLGVFGPLSLLALICLWALLLVVGFALLQWGIGSELAGYVGDPAGSLTNYLYLSGVTLFTLGYGDFAPKATVTRAISVVEAGTGFGLLATVIGYLPVLYQTFSRREAFVLQAYVRAGEPSSAAYLLQRHGRARAVADLSETLRGWEAWCAELLESYRSFPILAFYRSQRDGHSWLEVLVTALDACALLTATFPEEGDSDDDPRPALRLQAEVTFAIARSALVDLSGVLSLKPCAPVPDRLPDDAWEAVRTRLSPSPLFAALRHDGDAEEVRGRLAAARAGYEPWSRALARHLLLDLPPWAPEGDAVGTGRYSDAPRRT
jgi:hypothetical protein